MALAHATFSGRAAAPRATRGGTLGDRTAFAPTRRLSPPRASTSARAMASDKTDENSPPYQVAKRAELYELRIYGAYYVAAAPYTNREQGLASLMGYIEGGNEDERAFPATQPLVMRYVDDGDGDFDKRMELCLGAGVSDPPAPTSPGVGVQAAGGELLAVVGFEGIATPELAGKYRELLATAVRADGLELAEPDAFRLATYGQLYSLKPRLNELMLKVKLGGK